MHGADAMHQQGSLAAAMPNNSLSNWRVASDESRILSYPYFATRSLKLHSVTPAGDK